MIDYDVNLKVLSKLSVTVYEQYSYEASMFVLDELEPCLEMHWDIFKEQAEVVYEVVDSRYQKREP